MIVPFSTTGGMKKAIKRIRECAAKKGIKVSDQELCLKMFTQGHALLGQEGGHLTPKQQAACIRFANDILNGKK